MVVWNRNCKIRFPGCFFASPRWGKSKKRVLNKIIRPSSTRLYALLGKAHPKWWYETEIVKFDSQGVFSFRPDRESRKNAFWTKLYDLRQPGLMRCLEKPTQNGGMKPNITTSRRFKCVFLKWVILLDFFAWRLSLFLWALPSAVAENVSDTFGFIRFEKGEIFWKKTRKQAEATSKDWNNSAIKLPWVNGVANVSFCS